MLLQFIKRWRRFPAGTVTAIADGAANVLIDRRIAEPMVIRDEMGYETAAVEPNWENRKTRTKKVSR
jgi:hypothetical protein